MDNLSKDIKSSVENIVNEYGDMLFRICYIMLTNEADAQDAVQETIISYMQKAPDFLSSGHEKAWLITVAKNKCRDILRFKIRHSQVNIEDVKGIGANDDNREVLQALMVLPEKFKLTLMLYYVEGYDVKEIAQIIQRTPSAVKMRLKKGRKLLEESMERSKS